MESQTKKPVIICSVCWKRGHDKYSKSCKKYEENELTAALMFCITHNCPMEHFQLLLERGADPNALTQVSLDMQVFDPGFPRLSRVSALFEIVRRGQRDLMRLVLDAGVCNFLVLGSSLWSTVDLLAVVRWFEKFELLADVLMHNSRPTLQLTEEDCILTFPFMRWSCRATKDFLPTWFERRLECLSLCINRICMENAISPSLFRDVKKNILFRFVHEDEVLRAKAIGRCDCFPY